MDLKRLLNGFIKKLWLVIVLPVAGAIIAGYLSLAFYIPQYQAEATLLAINNEKTAITGEALDYQDFMLSQQLIKNYVEIISSNRVTSAALSELKNYNLTPEHLRRMININYKKDSSVIVVKAIAPEPRMASAVANAVCRAFANKMRELTNSQSLSILDEAKIPQMPMSSGNNKKIMMGFLVGMTIAVGIILVIELFDSTIRSAEDIDNNTDMQIIGIIPEHDIR